MKIKLARKCKAIQEENTVRYFFMAKTHSSPKKFTFNLIFIFGGWGIVSHKHQDSEYPGASLVAQWLKIHLPMQGTWVRALVLGDPTCRGATKPTHHNC